MTRERMPTRYFRHPQTHRFLSQQVMNGEMTPGGIIISMPIRRRVDIPRAVTPSRQQGNIRLPNVNAGSWQY